LEGFLADQEQSLFDLNRRIVLFDLTNSYFEGQRVSNPKAQFGRSNDMSGDGRYAAASGRQHGVKNGAAVR
jgi:hypothetical protein